MKGLLSDEARVHMIEASEDAYVYFTTNNGQAAWSSKSQMASTVLIITARGGGTWKKVMSWRDFFFFFLNRFLKTSCSWQLPGSAPVLCFYHSPIVLKCMHSGLILTIKQLPGQLSLFTSAK